MSTEYLTREQLDKLYGPSFVEMALSDTGADFAELLAGIHAEVDAYVSKQVAMPPHPEAVAQCRPAAAKLVAAMLYVQAPPEAITAGAQEARKFLENVATGKVQLYVAPPSCPPEGGPCMPAFRFAFSSAPRILSDPPRRRV
ncbi:MULTISPECIES: phage protein Gp36 family protein [Delftia]|uniref:DUF1320 family protein n=1 Tax=Delftia lacustris TaxID=558537 RepID=A0A7T2YS32_9BURK|nr:MULTISPECIES: phage protein Gp36 family protein [Delftia]EPD46317.1 hypothetical protein HMPREF9702_00340 [Delftia acidovorans CCUG 15835]QPS80907.1 DUF1320 family protein [Delftia lacustris]